MEIKRIEDLQSFFYEELVDDVVPFWLNHAIDRNCGGYIPFLDRKGDMLSPDKGMWVHGRFIWLLSRMYNELEKRPEWLDAAKHGVNFLLKHGFDENGRMYFTLTREGKPLRMRRYPFTEIFGVIALAEYGRAVSDRTYVEKARELMQLAEHLVNTPGALAPKFYPEAMRSRSHSVVMIRINTYQVLRKVDPDNSYDRHIDRAIEDIFRYFVKPEKEALLETVGINGEILDSPTGRCVNPGHAIETAWFILEEARRRNDPELMAKTLPLLDWSLELGWDDRYGGLFSFVDVDGRQAEQVEWDMKYWWPHTEAIYAALLAHALTDDRKYIDWFDRLLDWSLAHFQDKTHGEWFGYLHRDGSTALDLKGNNWKGPFHLPRQQLFCHQLLEEMAGGESLVLRK